MAPNSTENLQRAYAMAKLTASARPTNADSVGTLGAGQYRLSQYEEALTALSKANSMHRDASRCRDTLFLAMTNYRLERVQDAKTLLEEAVVWLNKDLPDSGNDSHSDPPSWDDRMELEALCREATSLIKKE